MQNRLLSADTMAPDWKQLHSPQGSDGTVIIAGPLSDKISCSILADEREALASGPVQVQTGLASLTFWQDDQRMTDQRPRSGFSQAPSGMTWHALYQYQCVHVK